jgi:hypothetical protein
VASHCVGSSGVALVYCPGYDSPSVLCFVWPHKKNKSCAVDVGGHCPPWGPAAWRVYRLEATLGMWPDDFVLFTHMTNPGRSSLAHCHGVYSR